MLRVGGGKARPHHCATDLPQFVVVMDERGRSAMQVAPLFRTACLLCIEAMKCSTGCLPFMSSPLSWDGVEGILGTLREFWSCVQPGPDGCRGKKKIVRGVNRSLLTETTQLLLRVPSWCAVCGRLCEKGREIETCRLSSKFKRLCSGPGFDSGTLSWFGVLWLVGKGDGSQLFTPSMICLSFLGLPPPFSNYLQATRLLVPRDTLIAMLRREHELRTCPETQAM